MSILMLAAAAMLGDDKTPNAINWSDPSGAAPGPADSDTKSITGINRTITLRFNIASGSLGWSYNKDGAGFVGFSDEATLPVANGTTLQFRVSGSAGSGSLEVLNQSDGDAVLDTLSAILT